MIMPKRQKLRLIRDLMRLKWTFLLLRKMKDATPLQSKPHFSTHSTWRRQRRESQQPVRPWSRCRYYFGKPLIYRCTVCGSVRQYGQKIRYFIFWRADRASLGSTELCASSNRNSRGQRRRIYSRVAVPETFAVASNPDCSAGSRNLRRYYRSQKNLRLGLCIRSGSTDSCLWQSNYYSCFFAYGMCNPQFCYSRI